MLVAVLCKYMYNIDVIYVLQSIEEKLKPDILNILNIYHVMQIHAYICLNTDKYEDCLEKCWQLIYANLLYKDLLLTHLRKYFVQSNKRYRWEGGGGTRTIKTNTQYCDTTWLIEAGIWDES